MLTPECWRHFAFPERLRTVKRNGSVSPAARVLSRLAASGLALSLLLSQYALAQSAAQMEQKLRLLDGYLSSGAASRIEASDNAAARALLEQAGALRQQARSALDAGAAEDADAPLSAALRLFSRATLALRGESVTSQAAVPKKQNEDQAERRRNEALLQDIEGYRDYFLEGLKDQGPSAAGLLDLDRLEQILRDARSHSDAGRHLQAHALLKEAHYMTATAAARIRHNQTVVYSLEFRTPADEYRYEQERAEGLVLLIDEMRAQQDVGLRTQEIVERFRSEGEALRLEAEAQAASGKFKAAIDTMERANKSYTRALQMMGIPVSG
jgi:hypothetical protein